MLTNPTLSPTATRAKSESLLPAATRAKILDHLHRLLLPELHRRFAHYDEMDAALYADFVASIPTVSPLQPCEASLITTSLTYDDQNIDPKHMFHLPMSSRIALKKSSKLWLTIPNTIAEPLSFSQKIDSDSTAWGKAVATIDASAVTVFSYIWNQQSYEHINYTAAEEGAAALRKVIFIPNSRSMLYVNLVNLGMAMQPRVFATWMAWERHEDGSFTLGFTNMEDLKQREQLEEKRIEVRQAMITNAHEQLCALSTITNSAALCPPSPPLFTYACAPSRRCPLLTPLPPLQVHELEYRIVDARQARDEQLTASLEASASRLRGAILHLEQTDAAVTAAISALEEDPGASKAIHGSVKGFWQIKPQAKNVCKVTYLVKAEVGGSIPKR